MIPSEALQYLMRQKKVIVDEIAAELFSELEAVTPVDTGTLKGAWDIQETADGWRLSNNMLYADVIFDGRGKKPDGIENYNLPDGVHPILKKYEILMQQRFDKIKV